MNKLLYQLNPLVKIIIFIFMTIVVSLDRLPFVSLSLTVLLILMATLFSKISFRKQRKRIFIMIILASTYGGFIAWSRYLSDIPIDLRHIVALAMRFIIFTFYSIVFVETVKTTDLVRAFSKYFFMSDTIAFSFLSAYRFIPLIGREIQQIKYSRAVRGLTQERWLGRVQAYGNYLIPLLVGAIRRGVRLAISMETRALNKFEHRTYYHDVVMQQRDYLALIIYVAIALILIAFLNYYDLVQFSANFS